MKKNPGAKWHEQKYYEYLGKSRHAISDIDLGKYLGASDAHYESLNESKKLHMNPHAKTYVGITHQAKPQLFTSSTRPTKTEAGRKYMMVYGPFKSYTDAEQFEDRLRKKHRMNPQLGKTSDLEHEAIDKARKLGATQIKEGLSWVRATFPTIMSSNMFVTWLDNRNYSKRIGRDKNNKLVISFNSELKKNPKVATEIYSDILAIEAKKGKGSLWPGERFRHDFKKGSKIIGLDDGSLLIKSTKPGQKLWKNFNY